MRVSSTSIQSIVHSFLPSHIQTNTSNTSTPAPVNPVNPTNNNEEKKSRFKVKNVLPSDDSNNTSKHNK
jgi:hypothetical protein